MPTATQTLTASRRVSMRPGPPCLRTASSRPAQPSTSAWKLALQLRAEFLRNKPVILMFQFSIKLMSWLKRWLLRESLLKCDGQSVCDNSRHPVYSSRVCLSHGEHLCCTTLPTTIVQVPLNLKSKNLELISNLKVTYFLSPHRIFIA